MNAEQLRIMWRLNKYVTRVAWLCDAVYKGNFEKVTAGDVRQCINRILRFPVIK